MDKIAACAAIAPFHPARMVDELIKKLVRCQFSVSDSERASTGRNLGLTGEPNREARHLRRTCFPCVNFRDQDSMPSPNCLRESDLTTRRDIRGQPLGRADRTSTLCSNTFPTMPMESLARLTHRMRLEVTETTRAGGSLKRGTD